MAGNDFGGFGKGLIAFLKDLEKNNDRAWFQKNKARFEEHVREPSLEFVRAMAPRLKRISKHLIANDKKVGGSMTRINRDTRFSKDKRPYKTNISFMFRHTKGKGNEAPGFFLGIGTDGVKLGTGIYGPEPALSNKIRKHIDKNPKLWVKARDHKPFVKAYGALAGESLKRPPKGFDAEHPLVEDLKRKDFVAFADMKVSAVTRKDFIDKVTDTYMASKPLLKFLADALKQPF